MRSTAYLYFFTRPCQSLESYTYTSLPRIGMRQVRQLVPVHCPIEHFNVYRRLPSSWASQSVDRGSRR